MMISCAPRAAILWRPVPAAVDDGAAEAHLSDLGGFPEG
jgi:hypothetical protein